MQQSDTINDLAAALVAAQGELSSVPTDKTNPHFGNHYASLQALWEAARPVLTKHGLSVTQTFEPAEGAVVRMTTTITHTSGQWRSGTITMPMGKETPQGAGAAITYARRYCLGAMLGMATTEDDDANAAEPEASAAPPKASQPDSQNSDLGDLI